jgi:hypothetical protein
MGWPDCPATLLAAFAVSIYAGFPALQERRMADVYSNGMSLRAAKQAASELGISVETVKGTGEVRFKYPGLLPVTQNNRRKTATRALVALLRAVAVTVATAAEAGHALG